MLSSLARTLPPLSRAGRARALAARAEALRADPADPLREADAAAPAAPAAPAGAPKKKRRARAPKPPKPSATERELAAACDGKARDGKTLAAPRGGGGAADGAAKKRRARKARDAGAGLGVVDGGGGVPGGPGVFVSGHFRLAVGEAEAYLARHGVEFRRAGRELVIETCPFCHDTKRRKDNMYKLYVDAASGVYFCHRCGVKGSWFGLRRRVAGDLELAQPAMRRPKARGKGADAGAGGKRPVPAEAAWAGMQRDLPSKFPKAMEYLVRERGLTPEVLKTYGVGAGVYKFFSSEHSGGKVSFTFPMFSASGDLVRLKVRAVDDKASMKLDPKGGEWGLFGLNTVPADATEVVLTEGEFDAMAVFQATGRPAISLPNGARSLPVELLPALERFDKILLWMDNDVPGQEGAQQFARKLGTHRCHIVRSGAEATGCKDANDALRLGEDLRAILDGAAPLPHEGVATFADLRDEIYTEFANPLQTQGVPSAFFPRLNKMLKGHRRGELTVVSGHTGVGKTTLLSQMSLDYCMQGVPTLWGSFEISSTKMAKLLLTQYYSRSTGKGVSGLISEFDEWADKFSALPFYFMRYFGSNPIERVLDAMEYANYVHDCSHVLVDNLQFMTGGQGRGYERFEVMDSAVGKLRHFATSQNVHVSLVVHPRKENDDNAIQTASVFGTGKATQEADNLVVLQRTDGGPVLDIRKNRFDGTLGTLNLRFNQSSKLFEERDAPHRETSSLIRTRAGLARGLGSLQQNQSQANHMGIKSRV